MNDDENETYYEEDENREPLWQADATYTSRPDATPLGRRPKKHRGKWIFSTLLILVLLAISAGAVYLVQNVGLSVQRTENGFAVSVTDKTQEVSASSQTQTLPAAPQENPQSSTEAPAKTNFPAATLQLSESAAGTETQVSGADNALSLQEIYEKMIDSVVSITTVTASGKASGTGIVMTPNGYIITNNHVIDGATAITVLTEDEKTYTAALVGSDELSDLAVLKVEATDLKPAEFGDSDSLRVGDSVVAIGDPLGVQLRGTMTNGIISAINRDLTVGSRTMTLIQTNAALNNGNSGGPLINCYGQVIGINTMKMSAYYSTSATVEGLGFAIPISIAKPIIDELIANGYVAGRPAIGIQGQTLPTTFQSYYDLPQGVYVTYVYPESDAAAKGLQERDIITAINGTEISDMDGLNTIKNQFSAGDTVTLTVYRGGQYYEVDVTLIDKAEANG